MSVILHMEPKTSPMSWQKFCDTTPPYSVAIDGYVNVGPRTQSSLHGDGPRANLNHHEEVNRLATRATCAQALMYVHQGWCDMFRTSAGHYRVLVYANDCDADVCTTYFILKYATSAELMNKPRLSRLVHVEDRLDTTAGAYPFPLDAPILRELAWIYQPYNDFRYSGGLAKKNSKEYEAVVRAVERRIYAHLMERGGKIELNIDYDVIDQGEGWTMVVERGAQARTAMFARGIKAFISYRDRGKGFYDVTVARMSPLIPFDLFAIYEQANLVEKCKIDRWGGGDTIGGSPRAKGTRLSPSKFKTQVLKPALAKMKLF